MSRPTAEERVRDLFEYPMGDLDDCERAASAKLLANMMREHAKAEVEAATAELRERVRAAARKTLDEMGGGTCIDGTCVYENAEEPCPWRHVVAALEPENQGEPR